MLTDNIAIQVRNLGKKSTRGEPQGKSLTFHDAIAHSVKTPFKRFQCASFSEEFLALKDVSLDVNQHKVVGIIGRNRAAKSTLLKSLSRITILNKGMEDLQGRGGGIQDGLQQYVAWLNETHPSIW